MILTNAYDDTSVYVVMIMNCILSMIINICKYPIGHKNPIVDVDNIITLLKHENYFRAHFLLDASKLIQYHSLYLDIYATDPKYKDGKLITLTKPHSRIFNRSFIKFACWGCKEAGHAMNKCPITSQSDCDCIINEYRQARQNESSTAPVPTPALTRAPGTPLPSILKEPNKKVSYLNSITTARPTPIIREEQYEPPPGYAPIVHYVNDEVLIDSGARSDHMCG
jgi:hypothetical protein